MRTLSKLTVNTMGVSSPTPCKDFKGVLTIQRLAPTALMTNIFLLLSLWTSLWVPCAIPMFLLTLIAFLYLPGPYQSTNAMDIIPTRRAQSTTPTNVLVLIIATALASPRVLLGLTTRMRGHSTMDQAWSLVARVNHLDPGHVLVHPIDMRIKPQNPVVVTVLATMPSFGFLILYSGLASVLDEKGTSCVLVRSELVMGL